MKCKENCGKCCGIFPIREIVWKQNKNRVQRKVLKIGRSKGNVVVITEDGCCCFLTKDNRCAIYDYRPRICRIYGESPNLPCPYYKPDGSPRTLEEFNQISKKIDENIAKFKFINGAKA